MRELKRRVVCKGENGYVQRTGRVEAKDRPQKEAVEGFLFISPWLIGFLIFTLGPLIASFFLSLANGTSFQIHNL